MELHANTLLLLRVILNATISARLSISVDGKLSWVTYSVQTHYVDQLVHFSVICHVNYLLQCFFLVER